MPNRGLKFVNIQEHSDARGNMRIVEVDGGLPFVPVRSFIISDVPTGKTRAGHAVSCDELLIVAQGSCLITARVLPVGTSEMMKLRTGTKGKPPSTSTMRMFPRASECSWMFTNFRPRLGMPG